MYTVPMTISKIRDSKAARATVAAYKKGYFIDAQGQVISPKGKVRKVHIHAKGYTRFSISYKPDQGPTIKAKISAHQLAAYQKFGEEALYEGVVTRHKDDNPRNNKLGNILIGSPYDNYHDMPPEVIRRAAIKISKKLRTLTDQQVFDLRKDRLQGLSRKQLSEKYNISEATCGAIYLGRTYKDLLQDVSPPRCQHTTDQKVLEVRADWAKGMTVAQLSKVHKLSKSLCRKLVTGKSHQHLLPTGWDPPIMTNNLLTDTQVRNLHEDRSNGMRPKEILKKYKIATPTYYDILHRRTYKNVPSIAIKITPRRKLSDQQVKDLRKDSQLGMTPNQLSEKYKIHPHTCRNVVQGKTYKDLL